MLFVINGDLPEELKSHMDSIMRSYTTDCARMSGMWTCSDCGMTYEEGMPMQCFHKYDFCDNIILRDKKEAGMPWE